MSAPRTTRRWCWCAAPACLAIVWLSQAAIAQDVADPNPDAAAGVQIVERGPVHEAYLQRYTQPDTAPLVERQPPEPVMERAADITPDDPNAIWIPGYWAWDDTRNDFIWVSGIWRVPPPGMHWIKGYWDQDDQGWRWIGGFWSAVVEDVNYIPEPPPRDQVDQGPVGDPPVEDAFWVPGCYQYVEQSYHWRPGYWAASQPGWIWTPAHYDWTPDGYVYTAGYWDYPLDTRGTVFCPVYFPRSILTSSFYYTPCYTLGAGLFDWIFARAGYRSYYFGNYFDPSYAGLGFYSWYGGDLPVGAGDFGSFDPAFWWYRHHHLHEGWRDWRDRQAAPRMRITTRDIPRPQRRLVITHDRNIGPAVRPAPVAAHREFERQILAERGQRLRLSDRVVAASNQAGPRARSGFGLQPEVGRPGTVDRRSYLDPNQLRRGGERAGVGADVRPRDNRGLADRGRGSLLGPSSGRSLVIPGRGAQAGTEIPQRGLGRELDRPRPGPPGSGGRSDRRVPRQEPGPRFAAPGMGPRPEFREPRREAPPQLDAPRGRRPAPEFRQAPPDRSEPRAIGRDIPAGPQGPAFGGPRGGPRFEGGGDRPRDSRDQGRSRDRG